MNINIDLFVSDDGIQKFFDLNEIKIKMSSVVNVSNDSSKPEEFSIKDIEVFVDSEEQKEGHVGKFLGIENIWTSLNGLEKCEMLATKDIKAALHGTGCWPGPKDQQNKTDIFLSKRGLLYMINKCRKPTHNLKILVGLAGVELHKNKRLCKEQDTLRQIMQVFNGEEMIHQFGVGKYRIVLYFPKFKWAIECVEFGHRDRDVGYKVEQQKSIEKLLNCTFVRLNPDAKEFCILEVVNKIFVQIKSSFHV